MDQRAKAERLRALHVPGEPLVLLNAWDAGSAAVIARAGAQAIATTSAGAANALGYPDGQLVTREQMLSMVAPIAAAVDLPVTADMEAGYGDSPEDAAATARGLVEVGGVGLNLEDTADAGDDPLLSIDAFVAKIAAVRAAGDEPASRSSSTRARTSSSARSATPRRGSSAPSSAGGPTSTRAPTASSSRPSPTPARSARSSQGSAARSASSPARAPPRSPSSRRSASPASASAPAPTALRSRLRAGWPRRRTAKAGSTR